MKPRPDAYRLKNLPWYVKVATSFALLLGLGLFWSGWVVSIVAVNWAISLTSILGWGSRLMALDPGLHWALFAAHVLSLSVILPVTYQLFARTPLPRLTRRSLFAVILLLSALDVACWALVSVVDAAQAVLGTVVLGVTLCLGGLRLSVDGRLESVARRAFVAPEIRSFIASLRRSDDAWPSLRDNARPRRSSPFDGLRPRPCRSRRGSTRGTVRPSTAQILAAIDAAKLTNWPPFRA